MKRSAWIKSAGLKVRWHLVQSDAKPPAGSKWHYDLWCAFLYMPGGRAMTLEYKTGIGLRKYKRGRQEPQTPDTEGLVESLQLDCDVLNYSDVGEWAEDLGYEKLSEAIRIWNACQAQAARLREFFGEDFKDFREATEEDD